MRTETQKWLPDKFTYGARLVFERQTGFWRLCIPVGPKNAEPEMQRPTTFERTKAPRPIVTIDPGERTP
jgi:hypothetical protein